jgi:hypothetical protein
MDPAGRYVAHLPDTTITGINRAQVAPRPPQIPRPEGLLTLALCDDPTAAGTHWLQQCLTGSPA